MHNPKLPCVNNAENDVLDLDEFLQHEYGLTVQEASETAIQIFMAETVCAIQRSIYHKGVN